MYIKRLKLVNFIGIYKGTGRYEIEIDLSNNKNKIIMLSGKNGSGKTTIQSEMHPFKESCDNRNNLILDGKEGIKEIDIVDGDNIYEIKHIYGKKAQSFIYKNGVDINPSAAVMMFKEVIENELKITQDYFKVGKIGVESKEIINMTTSERKLFMSKIAPGIEDYLDSFDIIRDKFKETNKSLKQYSEAITKMSDLNILQDDLVKINSLSEILSQEIDTGNADIALEDKRNSEIDDELSSIDYTKIISRQKELDSNMAKMRLAATEFSEEFGTNPSVGELEELIKGLKQDIISDDIGIAKITSDIANDQKIVASEENTKNTLAVMLSGKADIDESTIESIQKDIKECSENIKSIDNANIAVPPSSISSSGDSLYGFRNAINNILDEADKLQKIGQVEFDIDAEIRRVTDEYDAQREEMKTLETRIGSIGMQIAKKEEECKVLSSLELRPASCKDDLCPFIRNAVLAKGVPDEIITLNQELQKAKNLFGDMLEEESISAILMALKIFKQSVSEIDRKSEIRDFFFNNYMEGGTVFSIISARRIEVENAVNKMISDISLYIENKNMLSTLGVKKTSLEKELSQSQNVFNDILDINKKIEEYDTKIQLLSEGVLVKKTTLSEMEKILSDKKTKLDRLETFLSGKTHFKECKSERGQLDETLAKRERLLSEQQLMRERNTKGLIGDKRRRLGEIMKEKEAITLNIGKVSMIQEKIDNLTQLHAEQKLIRDALDPTRGIPLIFTRAYLEQIKDTTNELLDIAFGGDFQIDFKTTSSEFAINVISKGLLMNDIKDASQGEKAISIIAINLALIEQSIAKYNILLIDEIDGPLDSANRENFIDIIYKQIDKLGIEQVFLISHNEAFDTSPISLILLNGSTINTADTAIMKNKEIIFEL